MAHLRIAYSTTGFLITLILLSIPSFGQDYINNSLACVYGQKNYKGSSDAQVKVQIKSKPEGIEFLINIEDDVFFSNDNLIKSDHLEFWTSMDLTDRQYQEWEGYWFVEAPVDTVTSEPIKDFTGMLHWGLNLKTDEVVLFDHEFYHFLEPNDQLTKFITIKKSQVGKKYSCSVLFRPEAMGYSLRNTLTDLNFKVDFFDADAANQLSVLSTSMQHVWGIRGTLKSIKLKQPLTLCTDENPDNVVTGFYFYEFNETGAGKWKYYYQTATYPHADEINYHYKDGAIEYQALGFREDTDTLLDQSVVKKRIYDTNERVLCKIDFKGIALEAHSTNAYEECAEYNEDNLIQIDIIRNGETYAVSLSGCTKGNGWGSCGSCTFRIEQFLIVDHGKLYQLVTFENDEMRWGLTNNIEALIPSANENYMVPYIHWSEDRNSILAEIDGPDPANADNTITYIYRITWDTNYENVKATLVKEP